VAILRQLDWPVVAQHNHSFRYIATSQEDCRYVEYMDFLVSLDHLDYLKRLMVVVSDTLHLAFLGHQHNLYIELHDGHYMDLQAQHRVHCHSCQMCLCLFHELVFALQTLS